MADGFPIGASGPPSLRPISISLRLRLLFVDGRATSTSCSERAENGTGWRLVCQRHAGKQVYATAALSISTTFPARFAWTWRVNSSCRASGTSVYSWVVRRSEWPAMMLASRLLPTS